MELPGSYSKHGDLLRTLCELGKQLQASRLTRPTDPKPRTSRGTKKHLRADEIAEIVAKYEAGSSMAQLKVEHHMAKRTVAKVLREAGATIRPAGGQPRTRLRH